MRKQENYLDYIPKRNSRYSYQLNEHGNVEIIVKNEGFWWDMISAVPAAVCQALTVSV